MRLGVRLVPTSFMYCDLDLLPYLSHLILSSHLPILRSCGSLWIGGLMCGCLPFIFLYPHGAFIYSPHSIASVIRLTLIFYVGVDESAGRKRRCANSDEWRFRSPNRPNVDPRIEKLFTSSRHFDRRALGKK